MASWSGKSRGGKFGYNFFIFLMKNTNLNFVYFFIRFVAFYFLIFSNKRTSNFYFKKIHGYGKFKTIISIYKNYFLLGKVLVDKMYVLSGSKKKFTFDFDGEEHLREMVAQNKGGLLIGAHTGNWEVAGQLLERLNVKINIVMYEAEHQKIKQILEKNDVVNNSNIIAIREDFSHLFEIKEAFSRNEIVVMHSDRFLAGTSATEFNFMGKPAYFPTGPIYLASKNKVPVSYVYALKESSKHYHFFATKSKIYTYPAKLKTRKQDLKVMLQDYVNSLEEIVRKYPLHWFNYHPFWIEETNK